MLTEGQRLGEFEIVEHLGNGGMGAVFKARQTSLSRVVALKLLPPLLASDATYIARFKHEAVSAAALSHPNLVQVYSAGEADGLHYFAMEFIEGESALKRLKRTGRIEAAEASAIALNVASALAYAWKRARLIHRDIKPDNIFLSNEGEVKLGDLGLAKSGEQSQSLTMTGAAMGTPHYISPEQASGRKDIDCRADIYSLGCTLYHFLTGQTPYEGETPVAVIMKHVSAPPPDIRKTWPECAPVLVPIVTKMLQKDPAHRYPDYEPLIADLRRAYEQLTTTLAAPAKHRKFAAGRAMGIAVALGAVSALIFFAPWKKPARSAVEGGTSKPPQIGSNPSRSATARQTLDLLALVDPVRDRVATQGRGGSNIWIRTGGKLTFVADGKPGKIAPSVALNTRDYEIELVFHRGTVHEGFNLDFPLSGQDFVILGVGMNKTNFVLGQNVIGTRPSLATALRGQVIVRLQPVANATKVTVSFDGEPVGTWEGDLSSISKVAHTPHPDFPGQPVTRIYAEDTYEFTTWQLRVFEGEAKVLRAAAPDANQK